MVDARRSPPPDDQMAPRTREIVASTIQSPPNYNRSVSWLFVALLGLAVVVVVGAEWPRLSERLGAPARERRDRARRKKNLKLVHTETDDFAASVERDLANLPTIKERDRKR
jgi:hypothetical protein